MRGASFVEYNRLRFWEYSTAYCLFCPTTPEFALKLFLISRHFELRCLYKIKRYMREKVYTFFYEFEISKMLFVTGTWIPLFPQRYPNRRISFNVNAPIHGKCLHLFTEQFHLFKIFIIKSIHISHFMPDRRNSFPKVFEILLVGNYCTYFERFIFCR